MSTTLDGKIALVTGASRGIGEAIALQLAQSGALVVGTATSEAGAAKISAQLASYNGRGVVMDVCNPESVNAQLQAIAQRGEKISILVNNAGTTRDAFGIRMKDEDWDCVIETNLTAVFRLVRAVVKDMLKQRWGRVINITSVVGDFGNIGQTNYAAAKAGVAAMSRSFVRELGDRGITVNCVSPGFIDTDMTKDLPDAHRDWFLGNIPLKRLGRVEEIAAAVDFLASPNASYITGQVLNVNGGLLM